MTTVARRDPADKAKIDAIEKKLLAKPDIAKLIDDLGMSTTDANDLVRGMLQASITRGLNAEMDAHLGYESGDRSGKVAAGTDNCGQVLGSGVSVFESGVSFMAVV